MMNCRRAAPPILWFGNALTAKPVILTIGANPSRQEYLADTSQEAVQKVIQTGNDSLLRHLESPHNRFRLLTKAEMLDDIATNESLQADIIAGYNAYFRRNPYKWFGMPKHDSYNVEGFLRGMGASYFDHSDTPHQAIHIDLYPFATLQDFGSLLHMAEKDLFNTRWAQGLVSSLIGVFHPVALVVFGRTNCEYFATHIDHSLSAMPWQRYDAGQYRVGISTSFNTPIVGLSTNLGNPKGFTATSLRQYGEHVRQQLAIP